ncbi:DUF6470 family protein [Cohnella sp. GCM10020058]|uniref:DUF6470 family protein n=1 Tax=Cohnella sp. GCM10020058 TaxID=3317330 RepID=UPI00362F9C63
MEFLRLSIRSTPALLGIESPRGKLDIQSPRGQLEITSPRTDMQIRQPRGELSIDSSAAYSAYAKGGVLETADRIANQMKQRIVENIGKIAQEGGRMAQISNPASAVAEIAANALSPKETLQAAGPAGLFNVKVNYTAHAAEVNATPSPAQISYHVNKPEIQYTPQKAGIYVRQMNSIQISVSQYDWFA